MSANTSSNAQVELDICKSLAAKAHHDPLANHIVPILDSFELAGPNGVHRRMVFEAMGPTAASMKDYLPGQQSPIRGEYPRYPKAMAKKVLKHVLSGLAFLHRNGAVHGDVQPGNMLFAVSDLTPMGEEQLRQSEDTISKPLRRRDGKDDRWAPRYLARGQPIHEHVDLVRFRRG